MEYVDQIRNILMDDWDPLGVSESVDARDEYDYYVNEIYSMFLNCDLTRKNLSTYLMTSATGRMGLWVSKEKTETAMQKISTLLDLK